MESESLMPWRSSGRLSLILAFLLVPGLPWRPGPLPAQERAPEAFQSLRARSIGPAGMSGRIAAIEAVAADPDRIFVGAATGGVWKSENGGHTWVPVFDDERVLGIGAVAVFQPNPHIVWVGTGEGNPRNSAGVGAGIYKSLDGGHSWTFLGLENSERIHRIVLHPTNPNVAYAGVMGRAWSDGNQRGVYRTLDGGESWERVLFVNERTGVGDLVMDPENPDKLLAGMWEFRRRPWFFESGGPGSGLYLTHDGGESWTRLNEADGLPPGDLGRMGLAFSPSDPDVAYALVEAQESALLRSDDGGRTWHTVNDERGVARRPFYYADIVVDPANELRIFNLHSRLMMSEDGGRSFGEIARGVHSDFHSLWIHPENSRLMYAGTDGGVYLSRDQGENWQMVDNLPVGQFYHVSVDMEIPFNVYGGMQDNGSWRGPSDLWAVGGIRNHHWTEVGFGDGFGTLLDPTDRSQGYAMSQAGGLIRFDLRTGQRKNIRPWAPDGVELRFNWNAAIATDPFQAGTLYYGSQFVHKSTTRGESWEIISPDLTTNDPRKQRQNESGGITRDATGAENHTTILSIAPSPVQEELIWVGTDDGMVHLTRSGGGHWEDVGENIDGAPEGSWIPHIEASRHGAGTAYVIFDDHRRGNWNPYIYRTEDYGDDWENLADEEEIWGFVHTLEEDPLSPNLLFAGTEFGLYVSLNRGEDWMLWIHGIPPVPVRSLVVHPRDHDLVVGTHGRAIYILDDIRPLRALADDPRLSRLPVHLFQPPPAFLRGTAAADGYHFPADAVFQGETRAPGALLTYSVAGGSGGEEVVFRVLDAEGRELRAFTGPAEPGLNRLSWDLREAPPETSGGGEEDSGSRVLGPEVLPGRYRVEASLSGTTVGQEVEVLPDPRVEIPMAQRIEKRNAVRKGLELVLLGQDVDSRLEAISEAARGIVDGLAGRQDDEGNDLRERAEELQREVAALRQDAREAHRSRRSVLSMDATRDAPTEAERIDLYRLEDSVDSSVSSVNALITGRYEEFREAVAAAGLPQVPELSLVFPLDGS